MTWNYRILADFDVDGEPFYCIHSVYYDEDGDVFAYGVTPTYAVGVTVEELQSDMEKLQAAFDRPILIKSEIDKTIERKRIKHNGKT